MWWIAAVDGNGVRDTVTAVHANQDQIFLALIALVATSIAALVYIIRNGRTIRDGADDAATAAKQATAANAAVNNVGPGKHTLYDMVERIDERSAETVVHVTRLASDVKVVKQEVAVLKKEQTQYDSHGWETLPVDINSAVGMTTTIRDLQNGHKQVNGKLDTIIAELREHITLCAALVKHESHDSHDPVG